MILKQKKMYLLFLTLSSCLLILFYSYALAVPSLGVATDGIYYVSPGDSFEPYQDYFASGSAPASVNGGYEGFLIGPSGSDLIIFTNILDSDIYLLTDLDAWNNSSPIAFGGNALTIITYNTGQADGYKPLPYYALGIGQVDTNNAWLAIGDDPDAPTSLQSYYAYKATIEYSGTIPLGSYFFAAADLDDSGTLTFNSSLSGFTDPFSPRTSSATAPIPEPSTMLLLGGGLIGLGAFKRKFRKK